MIYTVFESTAYLKFTKSQHVFLWLSLQNHYRVTDEAFSAQASKYGPSTLLRKCSLLLKERTFVIFLPSLQLVLCSVAALNVSPYINHSAVYISFWSFEISEHILRNQNLIIGLDSYSRQLFIYLDPIMIYIKSLNRVPGFRCKVITGSLMRLFQPKPRSMARLLYYECVHCS